MSKALHATKASTRVISAMDNLEVPQRLRGLPLLSAPLMAAIVRAINGKAAFENTINNTTRIHKLLAPTIRLLKQRERGEQPAEDSPTEAASPGKCDGWFQRHIII